MKGPKDEVIDVAVAGAVEVAKATETAESSEGAKAKPPGGKALQRLILAGLSFEVNVHIDEPRHYRFLTEINDFVGGTRFGKSLLNRNDFVTFNNNRHLRLNII